MAAHTLTSDSACFDGALRRAKIVCTLGPATSSDSVLQDMIRNGMDVARLNFSHGTHDDHARAIERVRRIAAKQGQSVAILQDLQGPKIRTGRLRGGKPVLLRAGAKLTLTPRDVPGTAALIPTTFPTLAQEVKPGDRVLLSDGLIELRVRALRNAAVECEVISGGVLREHQGINLPGAALTVPSLTQKDRADLEFGLKHGVDMVALSFVRTADDVREIKRLLGGRSNMPPVIAKLEKPQAIEHLEEILEVGDGVMVARGDLGVEMAPELVPVIQKEIIRRAAEWRKPVITATQMLESMIEHPRPTRAEASDVANAIFDGTDAVMLSAETAAGKYPRQAVAMMARIIREAEAHIEFSTQALAPRSQRRELSIPETICESMAHAACELDMRAIAVFTETGTTARLLSKYRPPVPIYAFTPDACVSHWLNVLWGVRPIHSQPARSADHMLQMAESALIRLGAVTAGEVIGVVAGTRMTSGSTNLMRLHVVSPSEAERAQLAPAKPETAERRRLPRFKPLRQRGKR
jgi:pyruvate kinase